MSDSSKIFDGLLVLQYRSGKKQALGLLVNRYHKKLCSHSYGYTHDIDAARDIVQDCWGTIIQKLDNLKEPNLFGSWAFRIVTRKSLDYVNNNKRNRQKLKSLETFANDNDGEDERTLQLQKLKEAMAQLPENQKIILRLFYTQDYSLKEIATILETPEGTVKSRLYHAREKLKLILK